MGDRLSHGSRVKRALPRVIAVLLLLAMVSLVYADKVCPNCGAHNPDNAKFCKVCGAKLPVAPPPRPAPNRVSGSVVVSGAVVRITSQPLGLGVNVDGRDRGKTPLALSDLGSGCHVVEITSSGYLPYRSEFTIAGLFGSIVVTTEPIGAEVLLDGQSRGTSPDGGLAIARVPYGRHEITARLEGCEDAVKTVDVEAAAPTGVTCRLGYGKGWLVVNSEPTGARLVVNDQSVGKTPYMAKLAPDRYSLSISHRGYFDWNGDANVQNDNSTFVHAVMDRVPTRKVPLLIAAIAGFGAGVYASIRGESDYSKYTSASSRQDAERYHHSTLTWDLERDVAFAAGISLGGTYWTLKW